MSTQIEEILNGGMCTPEPLSLPDGFESPHSSLPNLGRFVRLLGATILILLRTVNHLGRDLCKANY